ncbi:VOC family protein [Rhodococcus qingshengii]|uniref:VOC family protein n=1 Tax=Rhodococcus qingshengii TaxID=334542 RepID=UPI0024B9F1C5|nr:VOC family protein [Rhodococcus qingshengii]MDJ0441191.1 VOC family protein [Rhodococcus qingshengii]
MSSRLAAIAIDCLDTDLMSTFWSTALGVSITSTWTDSHGKRYVELGSGLPESTELVLLLQPVTNHKANKNRLHLDIRAQHSDQRAEVMRLCAAGARVVDWAAEDPWIVMSDPEGNEFCVLPPQSPPSSTDTGI